jgi:hypothetical protein
LHVRPRHDSLNQTFRDSRSRKGLLEGSGKPSDFGQLIAARATVPQMLFHAEALNRR